MLIFLFVSKSQYYQSTAPREGAYIHGLFMEGARWDAQSGIIMESRLKELFPPMPVINVRVFGASESFDLHRDDYYLFR